jgi:hypothetical protein
MVQVVYGLLAAAFLIGFVFLGIGTEVGGGISEVLRGSSGSSTTSQYDDKIEAAQARLEKNPRDTAALLRLAENEWFKAKTGVEQDPSTGQVSAISDDAHTDLGQAADAWSDYLRFNKSRPDAGVAAEMVQVYFLLGDAAGAAEAQRIVATETPNTGTYNQLAFWEYASLDIPAGDAAARKAVSLAPQAQRKQVKDQLDQIRERAVKDKKRQQKAREKAPSTATPGGAPPPSPLGGAGAAP